jgi:hypothetical protein
MAVVREKSFTMSPEFRGISPGGRPMPCVIRPQFMTHLRLITAPDRLFRELSGEARRPYLTLFHISVPAFFHAGFIVPAIAIWSE